MSRCLVRIAVLLLGSQLSHAASLLPITLPPTSIAIPFTSTLSGSGSAAAYAPNDQSTPTPSTGASGSGQAFAHDNVVMSVSKYNYSADYSGVHLNLTAEAQTVYGSIHGSAAEAFGAGQVVDYLLPLQTAPGDTIQIGFSADAAGTTDRHFPVGTGNDIEADYAFGIGIDGGSNQCSGFTGGSLNGTVSGTCIATASLTTGQWLGFFFYGNGHAASNNGYATLTAADTAKITSIQVLNSQGLPDPNAILYDASGYNYNAPEPAATPEPASWLLGLAGVLVLVIAKWRVLRT